MRRSGKLALTGVAIVSLLGAAFMRSRAYDLYFGQMPLSKWVVAASGWVIATYGPVLISVSLWQMAKQRPVSWLLHLSLLPALYAALVAGDRIMLSTLDVPDFDSTLGAPIMPALISIIATAAIYFLALIAERVSRSAARASAH